MTQCRVEEGGCAGDGRDDHFPQVEREKLTGEATWNIAWTPRKLS
jgi:hypothetical protein